MFKGIAQVRMFTTDDISEKLVHWQSAAIESDESYACESSFKAGKASLKSRKFPESSSLGNTHSLVWKSHKLTMRSFGWKIPKGFPHLTKAGLRA